MRERVRLVWPRRGEMAHRIQQLSNKQEAVALWIWEPYIAARGLTVLEGPWCVGIRSSNIRSFRERSTSPHFE